MTDAQMWGALCLVFGVIVLDVIGCGILVLAKGTWQHRKAKAMPWLLAGLVVVVVGAMVV